MFLICSSPATHMDWNRAIEINKAALIRIVGALIAMAGLAALGDRLPRSVRNAALKVLRPAESAVRRLIVLAARGIVASPAVRPMPAGLKLAAAGGGRASFRLFDRRKRFDLRPRNGGQRPAPRIFAFSSGPFVPLYRPQVVAEAASVPMTPMTAWSPPRRFAAVSRRSKQRSKTCRRRRSGWPAGKRGATGWQAPNSARRFARVHRPDTAGRVRTTSTGCSANATHSPGKRSPKTAPEHPALLAGTWVRPLAWAVIPL